MRMQLRRFTRLTNAFSKKLENLKAAVSLYFAHYNLVRVHGTIRVTPAMEAGLRIIYGQFVTSWNHIKVFGGLIKPQEGRIKIMKVKAPIIKPGEKAPMSGIYKDIHSTQRTTLDNKEIAPPTPEKGGKWKLEIPTNPKKR